MSIIIQSGLTVVLAQQRSS